MRTLGAEASVLFVASSEPLGARLDAAGIPHTSLGFTRGHHVILHPRKFARSVETLGPGGALLPRGGYLAAALRAGGYRGRVVAVAHDAMLELLPGSYRHRLLRPIDRATGFWASDVDVAVSDFVLSHIRHHARGGRLVRIYNGVDLRAYSSKEGLSNEHVMIACAGRLIQGKGVDILLRAFAAGPARHGARLRIAGDGPKRSELQALASELRLNGLVEFTGWNLDMPSFWRASDIATLPSDTFIESFGMAAIEAMACTKPVVVTANGALPELVEDGVTGAIVPPGDAGALADALVTLTHDAKKRQAAGRAARALRTTVRYP